MLTYTLSRREKILLLILAIILVLLAWFMLVFQRTNEQIVRLDGEIATAQSDITIASAQVGKMNYMEQVIEQCKQAGVQPRPVPSFDNMTPLMTELNATLDATSNYTLSFDDLDRETSSEYVLRGVRADYSCETVAQAEAVAGALENGRYPCVIDSVMISDQSAGGSVRTVGVTGSSPVSASVHVTFIERA